MKEVKQRVLVFFIIGVATLTVRCQPACKAGVNCGDDLGNMTENECCVENQNSRAIRIGFDSNSYHVNEPDGAATLRVQLLGGTISEGRDILVRITTGDMSAQAPLDYATVSQVLTFSSSVTFQTMSVSIEDDNLLEIDEIFNASLALENGTDADEVVLQSDLAVITILDEDEVTIGFLPSMYSVVEEDDLAVDLYVQLISGQLGREVTVNLTTQSGSATVGSDFVGVELTFNQEVINTYGGVRFQVSIINDNILEEMVESFTATLTSLAPRLNLSPGIATVDIIDNDLVTFGFDATQYTVLESTPFTTVTIHQTSGGALDRNVVLLLKTEDGTAISSGEQDFEAHTMELTFGPDVTEQDVMIAIVDDLRLERNNHFIVSLNITDMAITLSPRQTSINIIDNDEVIIGFNQTQYQVDEDVGQAIINVEVRMGILRKPVVVFVFTINDVAFEGDDYSIVEPRPLTFNRNTSSFLIAINITDDQVHELSENLFGRLSTADGNVILQPQETRIHIADNDVVTFNFRQPVYMFMENVGTGSVCVEKIGETDQAITMIINGANQLGPLNMTLVLLQNVGSSCIDFDVIDDDIALEDPEEFIWTLQPVSIVPRVEITSNTTRVFIIDSDPVIFSLMKSQDTPEAIGTAQVCVTFGNSFAQSFEISPRVERPLNSSAIANATPGLDYSVAVAPTMANPGDSQACFNIVIEDDMLVEENQECFMVSFTPLVNLTVSTISSVCCIVDDDNVTIGFYPTKYFVNESDGSVSLTVQVLAGQLARTVSVEFFTQNGTATSTTPVDFDSIDQRAPITLQFSPDELIQQVTVKIIDDDITENTERFSGLLSSSDAAVILAPDTASVEIQDSDSVTIGFLDTLFSVHENDSEVNLQIGALSGSLQTRLSFIFSSEDSEAVAGEDFINTTNPVNITLSTDVSPPIKITIIDDRIFERTETFFITLSLRPDVVLPPGVTLNQTLAEINILDNDEIKFGLELTDKQVNESSDSIQLNVIRFGQFNEIYRPSIEYRFSTNRSSIAHEIDDFKQVADIISNNQQITFTNCDRTKGLILTIENDAAFENDENIVITLTVILTQIVNGSDIRLNLSEEEERRLILNMTEITVIIQDDDAITLGFNSTKYRVDENIPGGVVAVNVSVLNGTLQKDVVIILSTEDSTAISNVDYMELINHTVTFNSNKTSAIVNIAIIETSSTQYEDDEEFIVHLSFPGQPISRVTLDPNKTTVEIVEFDGDVGFTSSEYNTSEGDNLEIIVALLFGKLRDAIVLSLVCSSQADDLIIPDMSMEVTLSPSTPNKTINIEIVKDNFLEGKESFILKLNFTGGETHRLNLKQPNTTVIICDNDRLTIGFSRAAYTVNENDGEITLTVEVDNALSRGITLKKEILLNITTHDGSATGDSDYITMAGLQIELNESVSMTSVNYSIVNDRRYEQTERFSINLSFSGEPIPGVTLGSTEVVIMDDDVSQLVIAVVVPLSVLLLIVIVGLIVLCLYCYRHSHQSRKGDAEFQGRLGSLDYTVQSSYKLDIPPHLIIHASTIEMKQTVGQGEFGVVYKGHIIVDQGRIVTETVAIKTLKGFYDGSTVRDMLKECSKMSKFDHPNILTLRGVCLDGGPAPYIIMPFMANGNLLTYLKDNRKTLVIASGCEENEVRIIRKRLQDMCLQVARGMEYLAKMKVVHRDLAARNCMIDLNYVIKVGDFGLTEYVGIKEYYRQNKLSNVKLPIRWLAPESLQDYIFSEKSDVWAYGVTCWEIFTAGKVPYATVNLNDLLTQLNNGYHLEKPGNDACDDEMHTLMLRCWELEPKDRPTFSDLVSSLSQSLEAMASYMDVGAFGKLQMESKSAGNSAKTEPVQVKDHHSSEKESKANISPPTMQFDET